MTDREDYQAEVRRLQAVKAGKPRRTTVSELAMALVNRGSRESEGVELTWNAKGDVQAKIDTAVHEGETLRDATDRAMAELERIREKYPRASL